MKSTPRQQRVDKTEVLAPEPTGAQDEGRPDSSPTPRRAVWQAPQLWLGMLIALGLACRFYGLNWDEGAGLHPDERFCAGLVPRLGWPSSPSGWFDSAISPLNPDNLKDQHYVYGQLALFLANAWMHLIGLVKSNADSLPVYRALSATFDAITVVFTALIGRRLLGATGGALAGVFVALAALNVQGAHYFTTDSFAATFLTLAFWCGARWLDKGCWLDALGLGALWGASLACKLSGALFGIAFLAFAVLALSRFGARRSVPLALGSLALCFVVFRVFHPMAFQGTTGFFDLRLEPRFWGDFNGQLAITRGEADVPFNVQWIGRAPLLFSLANLGWWGWGWPLLLSGLAGAVFALTRPRRVPVLFVTALFALATLGVQGAQFSKFTRYFVPLTPMVALLAANFWREVLLHKPRWKLALVATLLYSLVWCASVTAIYGRRHPRLEASDWINAHIPPGTPIANETLWDEGLPIGPGSVRAQLLNTYDLDTPDKRANIEKVLGESDWIFLSSERSWRTIPRWPQKWPMMPTFYAALFDGRLGFSLEHEETNYPGVGPLRFPDDGLEEALSVYDHPRVLLFHKNANYSPERVAQVLSATPLSEPNVEYHPRAAPGKWDVLPEPR